MDYRLKNDLTEIRLLAEAVGCFGLEKGLPPKLIFQVNLALDEILTNTISYGYPEGGEREIQVRLIMEETKDLIIEVRDDGLPFNPLEADEPDINQDINERPIGGLGIHLVRQITDEIEYQWKEGCNVLVMRKHIQLS